MDFVPQAEQAALEDTEGIVLYSDKETSLFQFAMRQDVPPFDNVKVRQALSCAVDREAGVDAELTLFDVPTAKQKTVQGEFEIVVETVIPTYADPDFLWSFFHSQSLWGQNLKLNDPEVDAWLDQARASTDREERKQLYTQVLQRLMETVPMVFLMTRQTSDAAWSDVKDYIHFPGLAWSGERAFEWWLDR
jgi:ABC-type transport system substrate-binding protein